MLRRVHDRWQRDPRPGVLVIVAGIALVGFLALVAAVMLAPAFGRFDLAVTTAIRSFELPGLEQAAVIVTRVGDFGPMAVFTVLTGVVLWGRGRRTSAVTIVLAVLSGSLFGSLLKLLVARARPVFDAVSIPIPATYSFPSGHALTSILFFGSLVILTMLHVRRLDRAFALSALCVLGALTISLSRVYVGVHYLGDVIGSWLLGVGWLAVVVIVSARWGAGSDSDDVVATAPSEG